MTVNLAYHEGFVGKMMVTPSLTPLLPEKEEYILREWRSGNKKIFTDLFRTYQRQVMGVLKFYVSSSSELEDVLQNVFIEVYKSLDSFEGRSKLSSWIFRIAIFVALRHRKQSFRFFRNLVFQKNTKDKNHEVSFDAPDTETPHHLFVKKEAEKRIQKILSGISEKKKTVMILNDLQGVSQTEIAEIVNTSLATVRTRLFHARKEFWSKIEKDPFFKDEITQQQIHAVFDLQK